MYSLSHGGINAYIYIYAYAFIHICVCISVIYKEKNLSIAICDMFETWRCCAKWKKLIDTDKRLVNTRGRKVDEMGKGGHKVQSSSCKINKSWGSNVECREYH